MPIFFLDLILKISLLLSGNVVHATPVLKSKDAGTPWYKKLPDYHANGVKIWGDEDKHPFGLGKDEWFHEYEDEEEGKRSFMGNFIGRGMIMKILSFSLFWEDIYFRERFFVREKLIGLLDNSMQKVVQKQWSVL